MQMYLSFVCSELQLSEVRQIKPVKVAKRRRKEVGDGGKVSDQLSTVVRKGGDSQIGGGAVEKRKVA
ncbi:hypothetical protein V6Z12_D02G099200 [Gossypium hirsutum]